MAEVQAAPGVTDLRGCSAPYQCPAPPSRSRTVSVLRALCQGAARQGWRLGSASGPAAPELPVAALMRHDKGNPGHAGINQLSGSAETASPPCAWRCGDLSTARG